jgi:predicted hydrolase (HD superfamily)
MKWEGFVGDNTSILDIEKACLEIGEFFKIAIEAIQLIGPEIGL